MTANYKIAGSRFGEFGIVWQDNKIVRVFLPKPRKKMLKIIHADYPGARKKNEYFIDDFCKKLRSFFRGEPVSFSIAHIDLLQLYNFQKKVILIERLIPYGWVSTYGRLARKLGQPKAARAVGQALSRNPFPIIIPCHRTVKSDGSLGGYAGGLKLKRNLLELEGVRFAKNGKIVMKKVW